MPAAPMGAVRVLLLAQKLSVAVTNHVAAFEALPDRTPAKETTAYKRKLKRTVQTSFAMERANAAFQQAWKDW